MCSDQKQMAFPRMRDWANDVSSRYSQSLCEIQGCHFSGILLIILLLKLAGHLPCVEVVYSHYSISLTPDWTVVSNLCCFKLANGKPWHQSILTECLQALASSWDVSECWIATRHLPVSENTYVPLVPSVSNLSTVPNCTIDFSKPPSETQQVKLQKGSSAFPLCLPKPTLHISHPVPRWDPGIYNSSMLMNTYALHLAAPVQPSPL